MKLRFSAYALELLFESPKAAPEDLISSLILRLFVDFLMM